VEAADEAAADESNPDLAMIRSTAYRGAWAGSRGRN
jgi:hypothetical protein